MAVALAAEGLAAEGMAAVGMAAEGLGVSFRGVPFAGVAAALEEAAAGVLAGVLAVLALVCRGGVGQVVIQEEFGSGRPPSGSLFVEYRRAGSIQ